MICLDASSDLLPTKCLVWQAQVQLIKIHARTTVTVREEQGVLFFLTPLLKLILFLKL